MPDYTTRPKTTTADIAAGPTTAPTTTAKEQLRSGLKGMGYAAGQAKLSPASGAARPDLGLTPSQQRYVETIAAIEAANPKATAYDIAMAVSLLLWEGRIWDRSGKASDVTRPAGAPLVLDYAGGDGYKNVKTSDEQQQFLQKQRGVKDRQGQQSGVAHAFPAVAAQAGREDSAAGSYNSYMVTKGGDFIQDMARMIVEQNFNVFREAEAKDNQRAIEIAKQIGKKGGVLSATLAQKFAEENRAAGK